MVELNGTVIVQFVNFFILVAILAKFAYKPLLQVMEDRRAKIAKDLENAEQARLRAEKLEEDYKAQLQDARAQAQEIIEKAVKQAETEAQAQLDEVKLQIAREKERAKEELAREHEKAMAQIREEVITLSVALAGKFVQANMDTDVNARLINEAIEKLDSKNVGL